MSREWWLARRRLPDGRVLYVEAQLFNQARLGISSPESDAAHVFDDVWDYQERSAALVAIGTWDGEGEPAGWYRHMRTGRRRPGGDPAREEVRP
jgi:hypothetical protein